MRFQVRSLIRNWRITLPVVLSLSAAFAVSVIAITVFDALLLRPLPVPQSDRLVAIQARNQSGDSDPFSYPAYEYIRDHNSVFERVTAVPMMINRFAFSGGSSSENMMAALVGANYFDTLQVRPLVGQLSFGSHDDRAAADAVVLSYAFWQRLGGDRALIGSSVLINRRPVTVAGVAPPTFLGTSFVFRPDAWLPLRLHETLLAEPPRILSGKQFNWLTVVGRLKPGLTVDHVVGETGVLWSQLAAQDEPLYRDRRPVVSQLRVTPTGERPMVRTFTTVLLGIAAATLLVACANATNLLLGLAAQRQREMLIKAAVGASRWRLLGGLTVESLLLAGAAGLLGVGLAYAAFGMLGRIDAASLLPPPYPPVILEWRPDARVLMLAFVLSALIGVVIGIAHAHRATRPNLASLLNSEQAIGGNARGYSRRFLVTIELAVATFVLVVSTMFFRTVANMAEVRTGIDTARLFDVEFEFTPNGYTTQEGLAAARRLQDTLAALPGVERVTAAVAPPLGEQGWFRDRLEFMRGPFVNSERRIEVPFSVVDATYFDTLGIPLLSGRTFAPGDTRTTPEVIIVNETMANRFWPGENPIGQTVKIQGRRLASVVGVAANSKYTSLDENPRAFFYFSLSQHDTNLTSLALIGRTRNDPAAIMPSVLSSLRAGDARLVAQSETFAQRADRSLAVPRLIAWSIGGFGTLTLLLALIGVSAAVFCSITARTSEFAVRLALGASTANVRRMILSQVLSVAVVGVTFGVLVAVGASVLMRSLLFGVSSQRPIIIAAVAVIMLLATISVAYPAAQRSARGDVARNLRHL